MRGYAHDEVFTKEHLIERRIATAYVLRVQEREPRIRCHELARAVRHKLSDRWDVVDGDYGLVEHTWLYDAKAQVILDVYCVGRDPMVQLIDCSCAFPAPIYTTGRERKDINYDLVAELVEEMSHWRVVHVGETWLDPFGREVEVTSVADGSVTIAWAGGDVDRLTPQQFFGGFKRLKAH